MKRSWAFLSIIVLAAATAVAQESANNAALLPEGFPPSLCQIKIEGETVLVDQVSLWSETLTENYTQDVPVQEIDADGNVSTQTRTEERTRQFSIPAGTVTRSVWNLKDVEFANKHGQSVSDVEKLRVSLTQPRPALMSQTPAPLDAYYRPYFAENIVVFSVTAPSVSRQVVDGVLIPEVVPLDFCQVRVSEKQLHVQQVFTEYKSQEQEYTVTMPLEVKDAAGNVSIEEVTELRTRTVMIPVCKVVQSQHDLDDVLFSTKRGEKVAANEKVQAALAQPRPAIVLRLSESMAEYFRPFLADNLVVVALAPSEASRPEER